MASMKERIETIRKRRPLVDHLVRMQEHYGEVQASQQAGAVTYFAFLSFFPILALAFFAVGWIAHVYPGVNADLRDAINSVLPNMVGEKSGQISLDDIRTFTGWAGVFGLIGVLYSGLGWISALRTALITVFALPDFEKPGFVAGKLRDLVTLISIGVVLLVAVALTGFVGGFSRNVLDWVGLSEELSWLVKLLTVVVGLAANSLLFFMIFRLLAEPNVPRRSLWQGALLGAVGFEILKQISSLLLQATRGQPAAQAFGIALILVVWINYFTRLVLYSAAFAYTTREARARRVPVPEVVHGPPSPPLAKRTEIDGLEYPWAASYAAGAASMLGLVALVRRFTRRSE